MDSDGLPILDAGHVLTALNKLDAGDPEELLLSSRDGKDLLVVSYADVQRLVCVSASVCARCGLLTSVRMCPLLNCQQNGSLFRKW